MIDTFQSLILARYESADEPSDGVARVVDRLAPKRLCVVRKSASGRASRERAALALELELALRLELSALPRVLALTNDEARDTVFFEEAVGPSIATCGLPDTRLRELALELLQTLGSAHDAGYVHGDLKPEHVLVGDDGRGRARLFVIDWGLATKIGEPARGGSAGFVAPELLRGEPCTAASDLFAFGATLRAALGDCQATPELARLIERCTRVAPRERPASAWAAISQLGGVEIPRAPPKAVSALPRELDEPLQGGRVVLVDAAPESGRSHLVERLRRRAIARREAMLVLEARPAFDPVLRLATLLAEDASKAAAARAGALLDAEPERRAAKAGTAIARMGAAVVVDDADRLDEDGAATLIAFTRAVRASGAGAVVLVGVSSALREALAPLGAESSVIAPLGAGEVRALLTSMGARADNATVASLTEASGGRAARVAGIARALAGNPALSIADALGDVEISSHRARTAAPPRPALEEARDLLARGAPRAAARLLLAGGPDDDDACERGLLLGRAELAAGRLRDAERVLGEVASRTAEPRRTEVELLLARVLERRGEHARANALAASIMDRTSGERRAEAAHIAAQSTLALGDPRAAAIFAARGLEQPSSAPFRARLFAIASDAALRSHDPVGASEHAARAVDDATASGDRSAIAYALARVAAAHALSGAPARAREAAALALRHAEDAGDVTALPPFVMNLATAEHALGEYGAAALGYERAALLAERLGRKGSLAAALTNLGGLFCSLHGLEEARAVLARGRAAAEEAGVPLFAAQADLIEAETWLGRDPMTAAALAAQAARGFEAIGAARQLVEAHVLEGEIELRRGAYARAVTIAERAQEDARRGGLGPRVDLLIGEARLRLGELDESRRALDRALADARREADRPMLVSALALTAELHDALRTGAGDSYRDEARRVVAEIAARIPAGLRERYVEEIGARTRAAHAAERQAARLGDDGRRLLRLAGRALRERDEGTLLETALDEAVAMTRAEHAFLLLRREDGRPVVAAARNLDRETIKNSRFRFSRGVAERVLKSGEPVVTASAPSDPFLNQQKSVLDLGLVSVLCVPVRAASGVIAALYLDHRFEHGRFTDEDREVIQALGDVVGLALEQARLRREAEARADELRRAHDSLSTESRQKDVELTRLLDALARGPSTGEGGDAEIVGRSLALSLPLDVARRVAKTDLSVLIEGESGTGKELFARLLHRRSARSSGPLVALNCGALPESLIESELFGHVRGAFTGATRDHAGVFRAAHGGTLFLDEVGELPPRVQTRLLRVLQEREVTAVGGGRSETVDVRVVAATNRDLDREVAEGRFRADLFFRLAGVRLKLPPLRERAEDLLELADALLARLAGEPGLRRVKLSRSAAQALMEHDWPGNVRELEHALRRAVALSEGPELEAGHFELARRAQAVSRTDARRTLDRDMIERALAASKGNRTEAARALGISRVTMQRLVSRLGDAAPGRRGRPKRG